MGNYQVVTEIAGQVSTIQVQAPNAAAATKAGRKIAKAGHPFWTTVQVSVTKPRWQVHTPVAPATPKPYRAQWAGLVSVT